MLSLPETLVISGRSFSAEAIIVVGWLVAVGIIWRMEINMRKFNLAILISIIGPALSVAPANAQATRTWVSGVGDDANPCSRTAPCKTFAGSISKTAAGGEINCLDPGGFGALTITKSITISCEAGTAGVLVSGTNGFVISAAATDVVVLNGLDFEGLGTGISGIAIISAATVHVQKSSIRNFRGGGSGITLASNSISTHLYVSDTFISNNGNSSVTGGIVIKPQGTGTAAVVITNSKVDANTSGVRADATVTSGTVKATVEGSSISGNTNDGATAIANSAIASILMIDKSVVASNTLSGVVANGGTVLLGSSPVTGNGTGLNASNGGTLFSYRTNNINGNTNDNVAASTTLAPQ